MSSHATSETDRYLGWPGQAISYKVGEREWIAARENAKTAFRQRVLIEEIPRTRTQDWSNGSRYLSGKSLRSGMESNESDNAQ